MTRCPKSFNRLLLLLGWVWSMGCSLDANHELETTAQRQLPPLAPAEEHARIKVMVVNFDPMIEGTRKLTAIRGASNPSQLTQLYRTYLYSASNGGISFDIVDWAEAGFPQRHNGDLLSYQDHMACINEGESCYDHQRADYTVIANQHKLCERVANREIDEVWLFGDTGFGFYESIMVGRGAFWVNADPLWEWRVFACPRPFIIMGFNYTRDASQMLHNFGHRVDSVIGRAINTAIDGVNPDMADIFVRPYESNHVAGCGTTHSPPNIVRGVEYLYHSRDPLVLSECDKVGPIQSAANPSRTFGCHEWGCNELGYHIWRFNKLPRTQATNWWKQIFQTVAFMPGQTAL